MSKSFLSTTAADPLVTDHRYQQALNFLWGRLNYERIPESDRSLNDFKLVRMEELLSRLGNPQLSVPTVHIAGSKGKGSTATMVARIGEAAGYRVGLFTSPHLERFEERFTINGVCPTPDEVVGLLEQIQPVSELMDQSGMGPTFFELTTAMAWLYFVNHRVDLAVMEVGLGGRLDSTNVCRPLVTAITSISRDHTRLLGDTLESIAREKAGIIKPGVPMIAAVPEPGPAAVIAEIAVSRGARLSQLGTDFLHRPLPPDLPPYSAPPCYRFDFSGEGIELAGLELSMPGEHQARNAALAVQVAVQLNPHGFRISEEAIRAGLKSARCPLRVEIFCRQPLLILDAAHNPASIRALCETVRQVSAGRRIALFGTSRDKEAATLLEILQQDFDEIWVTRYLNNPRALDLPEVERIAESVLTGRWRSFPGPAEALVAARQQAHPEDLICVTGSFFLAVEARAILSLAPVNY